MSESPTLTVPVIAYIDNAIRAKHDLAMGEIKRLDTAIEAAEKMAMAMGKASEQAITKAESAQHDYNLGHNDLLKKMDALTRDLESKTEAAAFRVALEGKIERAMQDIKDLRESRKQGEGQREGVAGTRSDQTRNLTLLISLGFLALAVVQLVLHFVPIVAGK